jgi:two-component system nitrate/nitrite sensor histidine kinase NarX
VKLLTRLSASVGWRARLLPWLAALGSVLVFLFFLALAAPALAAGLSSAWIAAGLLALLLAVVAYFSAHLALQQARLAQTRPAPPSPAPSLAQRRLAALLSLSDQVTQSGDGRATIDLLLRSVVETGEAVGASFVPLDERGQPLAAAHFGDLPAPGLEAWVEFLASPAIRQRCGTCRRRAELQTICPLLPPGAPEIAPVGLRTHQGAPLAIYCLPLRWGEHEFGVLNFYLPLANPLSTETRAFFSALAGQAALALESARLQQRAASEIQQLKALRQPVDLTGLLSGFLENIRLGLSAEFASLVTLASEHNPIPITLTIGELPEAARLQAESQLKTVLSSAEPLLLGGLSGLQSLLAAPLVAGKAASLGAILVANARPPAFSQRQLALLQNEASQMALVVRNVQQLAELQFNTIMAERTRLAREIHDGLAQTLGFLKLQTAQLQNYLELGELAQLKEGLLNTHKVLSEAYLETRQAIDGLRLKPSDEGLAAWLEQAVDEFQQVSGVQIHLVDVHAADVLEPEIQAQLIRIVQEALSNVRKHAQACQVWISAHPADGELIFEVRDDGRGFAPEDVPGPSRYGLQGMRERTELLGADFQIISRPQAGTIIRVRLPLIIGERF